MKKFVMILVSALMLSLLAGTALAAEISDPEHFFGGVVDWGSRGYRGELKSNPREAMEAYVDILQKDYDMTLLSIRPDEEDYCWQLQAPDGTEIVVRCVEDGIYYSYVLTEPKQAVVTVQREKWDWDRNVLAGEQDVTVLPDFVQQD